MLFKASGAGFAGSVDEQHEGFAMWNSRINPHTGAAMGPKCGVVGEFAKAIRGQSTKFMTAMYHGISICTKRGNPANTFYGEPHNTDWDNPENEIDPNPCVANHRVFSPCMDRPSKAFPDSWPKKLKEVMAQCCPV